MAASITDYFNKASNMSGSYPPVATVSAARASGGSVLSCDSLSGWATDTPVHFSTFKVATDGTIDTTSQTDWKGIVVGNTITEMTRLAGAADSGNASGDRVELNPTIGWLDDLITGLLVSHKQTGALKDSVVTADTIATSAVTVNKLGSLAVSTAKIANGAVTGCTNSATSVGSTKLALATIGTPNLRDKAVTSDKVDWTTMRKTLFEGNTNESITLSETLANFDYIEIYYVYGPSGKTTYCDRVDSPNGKTAGIFGADLDSTTVMCVVFTQYEMSGTKMTRGAGMKWSNTWGTSGITAQQNDYALYIKKVVGVKTS